MTIVRQVDAEGVRHLLGSRRADGEQPKHGSRSEAMPDAGFADDRRQALPRPRTPFPPSPATVRGRGDAGHFGYRAPRGLSEIAP